VEAKGLRFADPVERLAQDLLDELQDAKCYGSVGRDPVSEILPELGVKHGDALVTAAVSLFRLQGLGCGGGLRGTSALA